MNGTCGVICPPTAAEAGSSARCARSSSGGSTTSNCMLTSTQVGTHPPATSAQSPLPSPRHPVCSPSHPPLALLPSSFSLLPQHLPGHPLPSLHPHLLPGPLPTCHLKGTRGSTNTGVEMSLWRLVEGLLALPLGIIPLRPF